jgi:hypothetical protein
MILRASAASLVTLYHLLTVFLTLIVLFLLLPFFPLTHPSSPFSYIIQGFIFSLGAGDGDSRALHMLDKYSTTEGLPSLASNS